MTFDMQVNMEEKYQTGQPHAVLFDLDGTLIDTYQIILASFRHTVKTFLGRDFPDEVLMQKVGQPLTVQMWDFTDDQELHDEMLRVYREHNEATHDALVKAFPGIPELLCAINQKHIPCAVVTSKMHALAQRGLHFSGIESYIDFIISPDDCPIFKPNPEPVLLGCARLGVQPKDCLYVGDSPFDIQAGNAAGCKTVAVSWGMFSEDALRAENPDVVCARPEELLDVIFAA